MTTPHNQTELDKAIERSREVQELAASVSSQWVSIEYDHFDKLVTAAKRSQELEKERDELKRFKDGMIENAPRCGSCAENLFCASHMHPHDDDCVYTQLSTLHTEYKNALENCLFASGNLHSIANDELKDNCPLGYWSALNRIDETLSTPSAIATMKDTAC